MDYDQTLPGSRTRGGGTPSSGEPDATLRPRRLREEREYGIGDVLCGRYRIVSPLGRGGMGVVFRCLDETSGISVALKALPPELALDEGEMEEVLDNYRLVNGLNHPNIASVKTLERDGGSGACYLVMECIDGRDLRHWLRERRRGDAGHATLEESLPVLDQIASALDYAHGRKVIHRDIKPGNVMLTPDGTVKVLDFGLAAQIHSSMSHVSLMYTGNSGTAPYMAPEQWSGRGQGPATDQYALAVMAYEMLSGRLPFDCPDSSVMREAVLNGEPEEIAELPDFAWEALRRGLSKQAKDRFPTCTAFVRALAGKAAEASGASARVASETPSSRRTRTASAGGYQDSGTAPLVTRIRLFLTDKDWDSAGRYCERVLDQDPENGEVYLLRLMASRQTASEEDIHCLDDDLASDPDFCKALQFADGNLKARLQKIQSDQEYRWKKVMECAQELKATCDYAGALELFRRLGGYGDARELADECSRLLIVQRSRKRKRLILAVCAVACLVFLAILISPAVAAWRRQATIDGYMASAQQARVAKDWQGVQNSANQIFELEAGHAGAAELLSSCVDGLEKEGRKAIAEHRWRDARTAARNIEMLDEGGQKAVSLKASIQSAERQTAIDGHLASARKASEAKDWSAVLTETAAILELDRTHSEALRMRNEALMPGSRTVLPLPGGVQLELLKVKAGTFQMGSSANEDLRDKDETLHKVTLTKDYWLGKFEVTQEQYEAVMGTNPSDFKKGGEYPVENVNWEDAMAFCRKLNSLMAGKLPSGYEFNLPTEAQWEFAARGGNESWHYTYSGSNDFRRVAWDYNNSGGTTHPVGQKQPNELGLYDMSGNVWEWCRDWYGDYSRGNQTDPLGPSWGSGRVDRGGGWHFSARCCRAADRSYGVPDFRSNDLGFRVALVPVQ